MTQQPDPSGKAPLSASDTAMAAPAAPPIVEYYRAETSRAASIGLGIAFGVLGFILFFIAIAIGELAAYIVSSLTSRFASMEGQLTLHVVMIGIMLLLTFLGLVYWAGREQRAPLYGFGIALLLSPCVVFGVCAVTFS